jgi:hypothetical protein
MYAGGAGSRWDGLSRGRDVLTAVRAQVAQIQRMIIGRAVTGLNEP